MFKSKFKKLVKSENAKDSNFEIIKDADALAIMGGTCGSLVRCGTFTGSCPSLTHCSTFTESASLTT